MGALLKEATSPVFCQGKSPSSQPLPCPRLLLDHSETEHNARARALLVLGSTEGLGRECSALGSSAGICTRELLPQILAS